MKGLGNLVCRKEGEIGVGNFPEWDESEPGKNLDPVVREAVAWFAAIHADSVTQATKAEFRAWLRRDTRHQAAYEDVERMWSGVTDLPAVKAHRRAGRLDLTRRTFGKVALATAVGGAGWWSYQQYFLGDYRTETGERRSVRLPDDSHVEMAGSTSISLDFGYQLRLVTLNKGEAFFTSAADPKRPFVVQAGNGRSMGEGAFNVDLIGNDDVRVTVLEKAVDVRLGIRDIRVEAQRQLSYGRSEMGSLRKIDPADVLAWRDGRLVFVSVPLGRMIASINRWRRGNLIVVSPSLMQRPVTLVVDLGKVDDVPSILKDSLPIHLVEVTPYVTLIFAA